MVADTKTAMKLEKRLKITTGGYQQITTKLLTRSEELYTQLDQAQLELRCFSALATQEGISIQRRTEELTSLVRTVRDKETDLQRQYANLRMQLHEHQLSVATNGQLQQ
jgi:pre-mRNA-splicing factor CDC5/CEF1